MARMERVFFIRLLVGESPRWRGDWFSFGNPNGHAGKLTSIGILPQDRSQTTDFTDEYRLSIKRTAHQPRETAELKSLNRRKQRKRRIKCLRSLRWLLFKAGRDRRKMGGSQASFQMTLCSEDPQLRHDTKSEQSVDAVRFEFGLDRVRVRDECGTGRRPVRRIR